MSTTEWIMAVAQVVGGMSLFIFGMHVMTTGLRAAAGTALREVLSRTTRGPVQGIVLGTVLGFLAHSGAATTMIASFANAGLISLVKSIAPMLGANVGTSLSMQLISFDLARYCWFAIGLGFIVRTALPHPRLRELGTALIGFGLIFLGMTTISNAISPHRDALAPWLAHIEGETWKGRLIGIGIATILTAVITSSGAMIGLCFALVTAGVFTSFDQFFPIVMGSHIGTCVVALTASLSMNIDGRRTALSHLVFNVLNVALALAAYPLLKTFILWSSPNLLRQIANLHTVVMTAAALVVLLLTPAFAKLVRVLSPSRQPEPEPSHLRDEFLDKPEQALCSVIRELRRMARLCVEGILLNGSMIFTPTSKLLRKLYANEEVIDEVKDAVGDYLTRLTRRHLSRRQSLFLQHLDRCMKDVERIGDHLTAIAETSVERLKKPAAIVPEDLFNIWFDMFCTAKRVMVLTEKSLDPDNEQFQATALDILRARDQYVIQSMDAKAEFASAVENRLITPVAGYYFSRYIADLDRLVRHAKSIAFAERQREFVVKRRKLERVVTPATQLEPVPFVDPKDYLERLHRQDTFDTDADEDVQTGELAAPEQTPSPPDERTK
jgi:phosphate:Na+ symporter